MSSCVSNRTINTAEPPRNQKSFLKSKDLACPTCKKCIYSANHDVYILKYLSQVNSRALAQKKHAQSYKITKRYIPVEKKSDSKNHGRQIPIGQMFSLNKSSNVYLKTTPSRSGLTCKPTGRIFTQVGLKWIHIKQLVETRHNTNDSASPLGKKTHNPNTTICANSSSLSAGNNARLRIEPNHWNNHNKVLLMTSCKMESQSETTHKSVVSCSLSFSTLTWRGTYDLWKMRNVAKILTHTDYALWEVILNGDALAIASASASTECPIQPKTAE
ncbi:hypothetical protein Tco_0005653 [Tanacetum coccineum]